MLSVRTSPRRPVLKLPCSIATVVVFLEICGQAVIVQPSTVAFPGSNVENPIVQKLIRSEPKEGGVPWTHEMGGPVNSKSSPSTTQGRVLFFIATDDSPEEVLQMKNNLRHARAALGQGCCDVYIAHYHGEEPGAFPMLAWSMDWYLQNVVGYLKERGYKFSLLQKAIQSETALLRNYEFIWPLDSDIDLTKTDLQSFFRYARCSGALIVGPTFGDSVDRQRTERQCLFRHSDFVELTAPLFRANLLITLMTSPIGFQAPLNRSSDWGLDVVWCKLSAHLHNVSQDRVCGIVDAAPLSHNAVEDGGAIKKKAGRGHGEATQMFFALRQDRVRQFYQYESNNSANLSCHGACSLSSDDQF
jgi:hypothetical protein